MNDLNKQQVVLLCLLVSFVTSVATGITVVSLLDQSPQPVTQTINRVVERTVEKVIEQAEQTTTGAPRPVERVVETVVVNQEDLTVEAVEKNAKHMIALYGRDRFGNRKFAGYGIVVSAKGHIVTDDSVAVSYAKLEADYAEGTFVLALQPMQSGIAVLLPTGAEGKTFSSASLGDSQSLKLAQSVIAVSGGASNTVATGIVTGLTTATGAVTQAEVAADVVPVQAFTGVVTNIAPTDIGVSSMLLTLKGDVVGIRVGSASGSTFVPINAIKALLGA